jgi:hypothetical protein|tara:strand:+ start:4251 stop:4445 length:195 start_codon:yes stop_codon:yes gene_type:complete
MDDDWSIVYSTPDIFKAENIKNMLLTNNIQTILMNQKDSSYHFGIVQVYTKRKDIEKAKQLISE